MPTRAITPALLAVGLYAAIGLTPARAQQPIIGLVTRTDTNPLFIKMKQGAQQAAARHRADFRFFAGKYDSDTQSQVEAVEYLIAAGAKGILIAAADAAAIVPSIERARQAGILVIALDTPLEPADAADATLSADNFLAGELVGLWAARTLGPGAAHARIALLDLDDGAIQTGVLRDQGFLKGFGIDIADPNRIGDERDRRVVGHALAAANEEDGRRAMRELLQKHPDISLVYAADESAAAGAHDALQEDGVADRVLLVSSAGSCPGVAEIKAGTLAATAMEFPLAMAARGVEAVMDYLRSGRKPTVNPGLQFISTGAELVTDRPASGLPSMDSRAGLAKCWG